MSFATSPLLLRLRSATRSMGINSFIGGLLNRDGYEVKLSAAMEGAIEPGACVWDIGANVGHYTKVFADRAGDGGMVHAFEPSSQNYARLREFLSGRANVRLHNFGLSDASGSASFAQGGDDLGASSRIVSSAMNGAVVTVSLRQGDELIAEGAAPAPDVIKIDVEGHELEVLRGLRSELAKSSVRHVFVEVHFALLAERGFPDGPADIESFLRRCGFTLRWIDPSHLHAFRRT